MRRLVLPLAAALAIAVLPAAGPDISADAVLAHIRFLASDDLRGRGNGSPGLEQAADYIASRFAAAGLEPGGTDAGWFQPFDLQAGLLVGAGNELNLNAGGRTVRLALGSGYYPLAATPTDETGRTSTAFTDLPVVFAGYGISAPSRDYDDYAEVDVNGRAVLIFSHEPQETRADSRLNGARPLREATLAAKAAAARQRGARALIVVSDPSHAVDQAGYDTFLVVPEAEDHGIPVLRVRRERLAPLLDAFTLDADAAAIDRDLRPRSRLLASASASYTEQLARNRRTVRNVIGILPGAEAARRDEVVVVGAHYDHVGLGGSLSVSPERTGEIHNGADDNASGTAALIEIARAAAAGRDRFPRTVVFVAFAGEERGLLGSAHYAEHPVRPLANTIAMIDLDMVGRSNGKVETSGLEKAPSLEADLQAAARAVGGIRIGREGPGAGRSDDANFLQRRIPAVIFFTGFHDDYHRPGDDWEKIDAPGTARVAALALEFAARIAGRRDRPAFAD